MEVLPVVAKGVADALLIGGQASLQIEVGPLVASVGCPDPSLLLFESKLNVELSPCFRFVLVSCQHSLSSCLEHNGTRKVVCPMQSIMMLLTHCRQLLILRIDAGRVWHTMHTSLAIGQLGV